MWRLVFLFGVLPLVAHAQCVGDCSGVHQGQTPNYGNIFGQPNHSVEGYTRGNGTYVQPHQQTNPNGTQYDNWSTQGNVNPYTGNQGTRIPQR